jgi:hypothetical protein
LLKTPLVESPLLLQLSFMFAPPALLLGVPRAKLILTLTPGLFLAPAPFITLLIRQADLLVPLPILTIADLAILFAAATLTVVAL